MKKSDIVGALLLIACCIFAFIYTSTAEWVLFGIVVIGLISYVLNHRENSKKSKGDQLIISKQEYNVIIVKVRGARIVFYKRWDTKTYETYYKWYKIDDVKTEKK